MTTMTTTTTCIITIIVCFLRSRWNRLIWATKWRSSNTARRWLVNLACGRWCTAPSGRATRFVSRPATTPSDWLAPPPCRTSGRRSPSPDCSFTVSSSQFTRDQLRSESNLSEPDARRLYIISLKMYRKCTFSGAYFDNLYSPSKHGRQQ